MTAWRTLTLGEIAEVTAGNPAPQEPGDFADNGPAFVRMQDVGREHHTKSLVTTTDRLAAMTASRYRLRYFPKGTLLIPKSGASVNLNHRALLGTDAYVVSHLATVVPDTKVVEPEFLYYWSLTYDPRHQAQTTSLPSLPTSLIKAASVPLPPLAEQRRIVDILSRADGIVRLRREAQKKAAAVIPAVFMEMFRAIPPERYVRCEDACYFITKGSTPKSGQVVSEQGEGAIPFIKVLHISDDGRLDFARQPSFVSSELHTGSLARSIIYPQDVLMNIVGPPLGRICIVPDTFAQWNINQALAIFRARENVLPPYLFCALRSPLVLPEILKLPVGVRQLNISLEQCRNLRVPLPPLNEQQAFVDRLTALLSIVSAQEAATGQAEAVFSALLARAFSGQQTVTASATEEAVVA